MGDGVVSVDAERHEHVGRGVGHHHLQEPDELAGQQPRLPGHRHLPAPVTSINTQTQPGLHSPDDVRGHGEEAHTEIREGEVHDEEVHPGPPGGMVVV